MKTSAILLAAIALLILLSGCLLVATPIPPTLVPSPVTFASTSEPTAAAPADSVMPEAPYNENAIPGDDITNALAASEKDGKLVLLDFGANWCPDCVVLAALFEDPTVKPFLEENFRVVSIDVGYWDKNLDISEKYGNPIENGIPAVVVLAPNGEMIDTTKDGKLANARAETPEGILMYLQTWVAQRP
jgi:thiol-disulfide isomerase/thioredoxin